MFYVLCAEASLTFSACGGLFYVNHVKKEEEESASVINSIGKVEEPVGHVLLVL